MSASAGEQASPPRPFEQLFPALFQAVAAELSVAQLEHVAGALGERERQAVGACLSASGPLSEVADLPAEKAAVLAAAYPAQGGGDPRELIPCYPEVLAATCRAMEAAQLRRVLGRLSEELLSSQNLALGQEGRQRVFSRLPAPLVEAILDCTPERVLLEAGVLALRGIEQYTATLLKNERLGGKLQGQETIRIKVRRQPLALYLRWEDGPWKGRQVLYNEKLLGPGRIRVREAGLLGLKAVTLDVNAALAKRGTRHVATELGLHNLIQIMEEEFNRAAPRGHLGRKNHGIVQDQGRALYKLETILPREASLGYYCHRMLHYSDYLLGLDVKFEIFGFDDRLEESYDHQQLDLRPGLTDQDFDPANRAYRL